MSQQRQRIARSCSETRRPHHAAPGEPKAKDDAQRQARELQPVAQAQQDLSEGASADLVTMPALARPPEAGYCVSRRSPLAATPADGPTTSSKFSAFSQLPPLAFAR